MNRLHQIGLHLDALLNQARISTADGWSESPRPGLACWHTQLRAACEAWRDEFSVVEGVLERLPDGWAEVADLHEMDTVARDPFGPRDDPHPDITLRESRHGDALTLAEAWQPLWRKLLPAIRSGVGMPKAPTIVANEWERVAGEFMRNAGKPGFRVDLAKMRSMDSDTNRIKDNVNDALKRLGSTIRVGVRSGTLQVVQPRAKRPPAKPAPKGRKPRR